MADIESSVTKRILFSLGNKKAELIALDTAGVVHGNTVKTQLPNDTGFSKIDFAIYLGQGTFSQGGSASVSGRTITISRPTIFATCNMHILVVGE